MKASESLRELRETLVVIHDVIASDSRCSAIAYALERTIFALDYGHEMEPGRALRIGVRLLREAATKCGGMDSIGTSPSKNPRAVGAPARRYLTMPGQGTRGLPQ